MSDLHTLFNSADPNDRRQALQLAQAHNDAQTNEQLRRLALHDIEEGIRLLARQALRERGLSVPNAWDTDSPPPAETASLGQLIDADARLQPTPPIDREALRQSALQDRMPDQQARWQSRAQSEAYLDDEAAHKGKPKSDDSIFASSIFPPNTFVLNPLNTQFLQGKISRPIKFGNGMGCVLVFLIPFICAGVFMTALTINEWRIWNTLRNDGIAVDAIVIDRDTSTDSDGDRSYYLTYRFTAQNERTYIDKEGVSSEVYASYNREDTIAVVYDPNDPEEARPASEVQGWPLMQWFLTGFSVVWCGFIGFFTFSLWRDMRRFNALNRNGQIVIGEMRNRQLRAAKNSYTLYVDYEFVSPESGLLLNGSDRQPRGDLSPVRLQDLPVGTPVLVWYTNDKTFMIL
jgi:hypothetical protein